MAELWKPKPPEILRSWVTMINDAADDLTGWELKFIMSMEMKLDNAWALTEAEEKKLEQIYADKTRL